MKKFLILLVLLIVVLGPIYLGLAFINWSFIVPEWGNGSRIFGGIVIMLGLSRMIYVLLDDD